MAVAPKRIAKIITTYTNTGCGGELSSRAVVKTLVAALLVAALLAAVVAATEVETAVSVVLSLLTAVVVVRGNSKLLFPTQMMLIGEISWSIRQGGTSSKSSLDPTNKVLLGAVELVSSTTIWQ
jgi:hypothetical protein